MQIQQFTQEALESNLQQVLPDSPLSTDFYHIEHQVIISFTSGQVLISKNAYPLFLTSIRLFNSILIRIFVSNDTLTAIGADFTDDKIQYSMKQYSIKENTLHLKSSEKFQFMVNYAEMTENGQFIALSSQTQIHVYNVKQLLKIKNKTTLTFDNPVKKFKFVTLKLLFVQTTSEQYLSVYSLSQDACSSLKLSTLFDITLYKQIYSDGGKVYGFKYDQIQQILLKDDISSFSTPQEVQKLSKIAKINILNFPGLQTLEIAQGLFVASAGATAIFDSALLQIFGQNFAFSRASVASHRILLLTAEFALISLQKVAPKTLSAQYLKNGLFDAALRLGADAEIVFRGIGDQCLARSDCQGAHRNYLLAVEHNARPGPIIRRIARTGNFELLQKFLQNALQFSSSQEIVNLLLTVQIKNCDFEAFKHFTTNLEKTKNLKKEWKIKFDLDFAISLIEQIEQQCVFDICISRNEHLRAVEFLLGRNKIPEALALAVSCKEQIQCTRLIARKCLNTPFEDQVSAYICDNYNIIGKNFFALTDVLSERQFVKIFENVAFDAKNSISEELVSLYFKMLCESAADAEIYSKIRNLTDIRKINFSEIILVFREFEMRKSELFCCEKLQDKEEVIAAFLGQNDVEAAIEICRSEKLERKFLSSIISISAQNGKLKQSLYQIQLKKYDIIDLVNTVKSANRASKISDVLEVLSQEYSYQNEETQKYRKQLKQHEKQLLELKLARQKMENLVPRDESTCQQCGCALVQPIVMFLCGHSYHQNCADRTCSCFAEEKLRGPAPDLSSIDTLDQLISQVGQGDLE
ncbi:hypothetical protein SS50377_25032 [Spironucleus salmonicida]|uniref:Uncharacterized protein n=1 Tax=Spironucleus salmonicida TaxID=348837 RepID=V6LEX6_9EUKA|nr:hypothetical protein SS50377_25032 [Spironucleus salmonicida]|eukprot:EST43085.1 Hypothetical protein SS50377_17242 [Spironucleus salmonicida]